MSRVVRGLVAVPVAAAEPVAEVVGDLFGTGAFPSAERLPEFAVLRAAARAAEGSESVLWFPAETAAALVSRKLSLILPLAPFRD